MSETYSRTSEAALSMDPQRFFEALDAHCRLNGLRMNFHHDGVNSRYIQADGKFPDGQPFTTSWRWDVVPAQSGGWTLKVTERTSGLGLNQANTDILEQWVAQIGDSAAVYVEFTKATAKISRHAVQRLTVRWDQPVEVVIGLADGVDPIQVKELVEHAGGKHMATFQRVGTVHAKLTSLQARDVMNSPLVAAIDAARHVEIG